ncbi:unnamed protein product [Ectocarpus sp. 12 AP-2014]
MLLMAHQPYSCCCRCRRRCRCHHAAASRHYPFLTREFLPSHKDGVHKNLRQFLGAVFPTSFAIVLWWGSAGLERMRMRWISTLSAGHISLLLSATPREEYLPLVALQGRSSVSPPCVTLSGCASLLAHLGTGLFVFRSWMQSTTTGIDRALQTICSGE